MTRTILVKIWPDPHPPEVLHAATMVPPGRALDLGCGNGRNSLYLAANGFTVTAWDKNAMSINNVETIRAAEGLDNLQTAVKDLNSLTFDGEYDLILSTVVMMFLEAGAIPDSSPICSVAPPPGAIT